MQNRTLPSRPSRVLNLIVWNGLGYGHGFATIFCHTDSGSEGLRGFTSPHVSCSRPLPPKVLRELRVKGSLMDHKEIRAAMGVKIVAPGLESAVAGTSLLVVGPEVSGGAGGGGPRGRGQGSCVGTQRRPGRHGRGSGFAAVSFKVSVGLGRQVLCRTEVNGRGRKPSRRHALLVFGSPVAPCIKGKPTCQA